MRANQSSALLSPSALVQDVRFAGRMFVKNPVFTAIVLLTLSLGIGLNTAVFSAVEAQLLRPLPGVRASNELMQLYRNWPGQEWGSNSVPHYYALRERTTDVFSDVATVSWQNMSMTVGDKAEMVFGQMASANFFSLLGVSAAKGRLFVPEEDVGRGAHPVIVLSDGSWRSRFGSDPNVIGKQVVVNGLRVTVIGVTPPRFRGMTPIIEPAFWIPLMQLAQVQPGATVDQFTSRNNFMEVVGRVKPGVTVEQVRARMAALSAELKAELPEAYEDAGITVVPQTEAGIHPSMRSAQVGLLGAVLAVVAILLLIACVNVANLFLARANDRAREMAVRVALGARRAALVRQLLVESLLYAVVAALAGLLIAYWAITLANGISLPVNIDVRPDLTLSGRVLLVTGVITLVTAVMFGLVPALQATRPSLVSALKGEAPAGGSRSRLSRSLIVAQTALSIVLLVGAGLFLSNLRNATTLDKGFVGDQILMADLDPSLQGYNRGTTTEFYRRLQERLLSSPLVQSVALAAYVPLSLSSSDRGVEIPGYVPKKQEAMSIFYAPVSPNFFATLQIPLRGRDFAATDDSSSVPVLIVNQRFVDRFWPGQDGIGKTVKLRSRDHTVVGVVPTGKYRRLGEEPTAYMWMPQQQAWNAGMTVVVRTAGLPEGAAGLLRQEVQALDQNMPVSNVRTMDQHLAVSLLPARVTGIALGVFGVLGLVLASVGIYGVMAYSVSQRTREIGIRMAIGAAAADVVRLIVRQGMLLVVIGTVVGLVAAIGAARLLASVLYGGGDSVAFVVVPIVLLGVATVATWVPARRAAMVDPAITLRAD